MNPSQSLTHRVGRLENDTHAIYELLGQMKVVQDQHTRRLDRVEGKLGQMEKKVDVLTTMTTELLRRSEPS